MTEHDHGNGAGQRFKAQQTDLEDKGCPFCGAPPGSFCHTPTGKPRNDHKKREYALPESESVDAGH